MLKRLPQRVGKRESQMMWHVAFTISAEVGWHMTNAVTYWICLDLHKNAETHKCTIDFVESHSYKVNCKAFLTS